MDPYEKPAKPVKMDKFEVKLKSLVEKYGRIVPEEVPAIQDNNSDPAQALDDEYESDSDKCDKCDDPGESDTCQYYFTYEKRKDDSYFLGSTDGDSIYSKDNQTFYLVFNDSDFAEGFKEITEDPDMYGDEPCIHIESLYYSIHDIRIKYNRDEKYKTRYISTMLKFTEELFNDKYSKIDEMISNGIIDFTSLWYYLDKIDTLYVIKYLDNEICFRHKCFAYVDTGNKGEDLVLFGTVIHPQEGQLSVYEIRHSIKKFTGTKKLDTLNIHILTPTDRETFNDYGAQIITLYNKISHMYLDGKQYIKVRDNIVAQEKHERVMVDFEGMNRYSDPINNFTLEKSIDSADLTQDDRYTVFPFAYIFNLGINKTWGMTHIKNLSQIQYQSDAFDYLVLDDTKKRIIKMVINNHGKESRYKDFIKTKGNGLVFLLYGSPGTGKSFTAEATCELLQKPLFSINVGDLGTDPENMESVINSMIDYSKRWNSIIVIDEVDVFLEERETSQITRNAMVGVFLKLLEYHDGIMFLTTNRLNSLDSAIKSRINLMFPFEDLSDKSRKNIWLSLFKKWDINISPQIMTKLNTFKLNGREIRNYMKLVFAIHEEENKEITGESILEHLEQLFDITEEFNKAVRTSGALYT